MKYLRIYMTEYEVYDVPAIIIAENRADYYATNDSRGNKEVYDRVYKEEVDYVMNEKSGFELDDWASNNMDWSELKDHAIKVETEPEPEIDLEARFANAKKVVVERD